MCCTQYLNIIIIIVIDVNIIVNIIKTSAKRSIIWSLPWTDHNAALIIQANTSFDNFYQHFPCSSCISGQLQWMISFAWKVHGQQGDDASRVQRRCYTDVTSIPQTDFDVHFLLSLSIPENHFNVHFSLSLSISENHFNVHFHLSSFTCPPLLMNFHPP